MKSHYKPGELVLVCNARRDQEIGGKERSRYYGPYEVVKVTQGEAYRLRELNGVDIDHSIAAYQILPTSLEIIGS